MTRPVRHHRWPPTWAMFGAALLAAVALLAPWLAPYDPAQQVDVVALKNASPSWEHLFGTDAYSRDILSRVLFGARTSIGVALTASLLATGIGGVWGGVAGWYGGAVGSGMMACVDVWRSVPRILLLLAAYVVFGALSVVPLALLIGMVVWPTTAVLAHREVSAIRQRPFVEAARALGTSRMRVARSLVAPHLAGPLAASGTLLVADIMAIEAGLSFIGLGIPAPNASWGSMVQDAIPFLHSAWWVAAIPCVGLLVSVLCISSMANAMSDGRHYRR